MCKCPSDLFLGCGDMGSSTLQVPTRPRGEAAAALVGAGLVMGSSLGFPPLSSPALSPPPHPRKSCITRGALIVQQLLLLEEPRRSPVMAEVSGCESVGCFHGSSNRNQEPVGVLALRTEERCHGVETTH